MWSADRRACYAGPACVARSATGCWPPSSPSDLTASLDSRLTQQAREAAGWLSNAEHLNHLAPRLGAVTGTRITIIGADGVVLGDSVESSAVGQPAGEAWEVSRAQRGEIGHAIRTLRSDEPPQYLVAVPADFGMVIRLAVPLGDVIDTRARMRNRLLVGFGSGFVGCLVLGWIFIRALTRPLQAMTRTAEKLTRGDYDVPPPLQSAGELGVLARAMSRMANEIKARVGELTEQRDLLSVVFGSLVEGVVLVGRDSRVALVNDAARPLIGGGSELPERLRPLVTRALAGEQADEELELVGRAVRASARPLGDPGAIVVLYDVTRLRALEAVRREFLSNAAHELRTPVTAISGYAETLLGGGVDAETSQEFLTTIHRNAQRIAALVADLLVLDTLEGRAEVVGRRTPIALTDVVGDAARTARGVTPAAQIDVAVADGIAVLATRDGLDHIVQNLIDNAIKYGSGTPVTVTAEQIDRRVRLAVADRGPGIPAGHEDRIFERFYRLDAGRSRDRGGSGLGLAIVKSQSEAIGGRVWVESAAPGARFVVELDAA
ncbi:MAG: HAMP domain-containing protein [Deltaproteobacteria bacterium]|nr:MAG: HAMP domain-containing protein [Deltaproteobacteria bacterium]